MKPCLPQLTPEHLATAASYFISDLHLSDETPEINASFYAFLQQVAPKADAIYILGDFLDAWIGDDTPARFLPKLITACQEAAQHTPLYFLPGNRDFLLSDTLLRQAHIQRLSDPSLITLYNQMTVVCHGDHLCGRDYAHLCFRLLSQSRFFRWLFLSLPISLRLKIAGQLRSEKHQQFLHPPLVKFDVTFGRIKRLFRQYKTNRLIHGHTHRPYHHKHPLQPGQNADRWVLGAWGKTGIILRADSHSWQLLHWNPD